MWVTLDITPKSAAQRLRTFPDAKSMEKKTQRSRKGLVEKWTIHTVRTYSTCSTCSLCQNASWVISLISACSLPLTLHLSISLIFALRSLVWCWVWPTLISRCLLLYNTTVVVHWFDNRIQFHSLWFRLSVFHLFRRQYRDFCICDWPWWLCLPIHFNYLLSIMHPGWVCLHCQTLFGSNYSDCVLDSKVPIVK